MGLLKNISRKQRREFDKLEKKNQVEFAVSEIMSIRSKERAAIAGVCFADGALHMCDVLKKRYLDEITDENREETIKKLFDEIIRNSKKYREKYPDEKRQEQTGEDN